MEITPELIENLASYAALEMDAERLAAQAPMLGGIIGMVREATSLKLGDVAPALSFSAEWTEGEPCASAD